MEVQIQKWGNSLGVRIPSSLAKDAHVKKGTVVNLTLAKGKIVISPRKRPRYTLKELVDGITKENRHPETQTGPAVGREVW